MDPAALAARNEVFRLRQDELVSKVWPLGFLAAFGIAGILAFHRLGSTFADAPTQSIAIYLATVCLSGLVGGIVGTWLANRVADRADRRDIARGPSMYEPATQDERLAQHTTLYNDPRE